MKFTLSIPVDQINKAKDKVIDLYVEGTALKGFRKGKAPRQAVIDHIGESKIFESTLNRLLPEVYTAEVKKRGLLPITDPKFTPASVKPDSVWEFEVEIAEKPQVTLGKYQEAVRAVLAKEKIWTPGKPLETAPTDNADHTDHEHGHEHDHETHQNKKLDLVFKALLETCQVEIPALLLDDEVNHRLTHLIDQLNKMGMSIDDYLKSKSTTSDNLKSQYRQEADGSLKLEFILDAVTKDLKITVTDQEIDLILRKTPDRPKLSFKELANLKLVLLRRKTIERLLVLST